MFLFGCRSPADPAPRRAAGVRAILARASTYAQTRRRSPVAATPVPRTNMPVTRRPVRGGPAPPGMGGSGLRVMRQRRSASRMSRSSTTSSRGAAGGGGGSALFSRLNCFTIRKMMSAKIAKLRQMVMKLP